MLKNSIKTPLLILVLLFFAEALARTAVRTGSLTEDASLQKTVNENLKFINQHRPPVWLIGNSTLEFGINQDLFNMCSNTASIKLCHGAATVTGSSAMLDFYLGRCTYTPDFVLLALTKDDLNLNGLGSTVSKTYLEYMTWKKYTRHYFYLYLRAIRGSLYDRCISLYARLFINKGNRQAWSAEHKFLRIVFDEQQVARERMKNYAIDEKAFSLLETVRHKYKISNVIIVLLPLKSEYATWHDREYPAFRYRAIQEHVVDNCRRFGFKFLNLEQVSGYDDSMFGDYYHLNKIGRDFLTMILCKDIQQFL